MQIKSRNVKKKTNEVNEQRLKNILAFETMVEREFYKVARAIIHECYGFNPRIRKTSVFDFFTHKEKLKSTNQKLMAFRRWLKKELHNIMQTEWNRAYQYNIYWDKKNGDWYPAERYGEMFDRWKSNEFKHEATNITDRLRDELGIIISCALLLKLSYDQTLKTAWYMIQNKENMREIYDKVIPKNHRNKRYHNYWRSGRKGTALEYLRSIIRGNANWAWYRGNSTIWEDMGYIGGYEIRLSVFHNIADMCDELQGEYPVDFVFTGWHPNCICVIEPITDHIVRDVPVAFKDWVSRHIEQIMGWKTTPDYITENRKYWEE